MNIQIKIESGIPVPEGAGRPRKYPFAQMKVGDSFVIPDDQENTTQGKSSVQNRVASAANHFANKHNKRAKYRTRCRVENGKPVVRIWRIK